MQLHISIHGYDKIGNVFKYLIRLEDNCVWKTDKIEYVNTLIQNVQFKNCFSSKVNVYALK